MITFVRNAEIELEEIYALWISHSKSIPYSLSPRYHRPIDFHGFCDYLVDRFDWRIK